MWFRFWKRSSFDCEPFTTPLYAVMSVPGRVVPLRLPAAKFFELRVTKPVTMEVILHAKCHSYANNHEVKRDYYDGVLGCVQDGLRPKKDQKGPTAKRPWIPSADRKQKTSPDAETPLQRSR